MKKSKVNKLLKQCVWKGPAYETKENIDNIYKILKEILKDIKDIEVPRTK